MTLTHHAHTVYTRSLWNDAWTARPYLYAETLSFSVSPEIPQARLSYTTGDVLQAGAMAYASFGQLDLAGHYVKIAIDQQQIEGEPPVPTRDWYGVIVESEHDRQGKNAQWVGVPGRQTITAAGMEWLLDREIVDTSIVLETSEAGERRIGRAIGFNLGAGDKNNHAFKGNKSDLWGNAPARIFTENFDEDHAEVWNAYDILDYLLAYHAPANFAGTQKMVWALTGQIDSLLWHKPAIHVHGQSVLAILNQLIDRRRGLGWYLLVTDATGPRVAIYSYNQNHIFTPSGKTFLANPFQVAWNFDDSTTVQRAIVTTSKTHVADQVIARSTERRTTCFSVSYADVLAKDWSAALETTYRTAASSIGAEYTNGTIEEKQVLNRAARNTDDLRRVWRHFRVQDWSDTIGGETVLPDEYGNPEPVWRPGLVFEDVLPLLSDHDYSADPLTPDAVVDNTPADAAPEYLRPFGIAAAAVGDASHFQYLDRLAGGDVGDNLETEGRPWSASLRMQDDGLGLIVDVSRAPQHVIGAGDWTAIDAADTADWKADLDWEDFFFTVAMRGDTYPEAKWPDEALPSGADVHRTMVIDVPGARLDYVVAGTILGLDDEGHKILSAGGYIRDDGPLLTDLARIAFDWYSVPRVAIAVTDHTLDSPLSLGNLVTTIGGAFDLLTTNSVVTRLSFDLVAGTTQVETQFAELDVMRL